MTYYIKADFAPSISITVSYLRSSSNAFKVGTFPHVDCDVLRSGEESWGRGGGKD